MAYKRILIVSKSSEAAAALERLLELERGFSVETRVLEAWQADPLRSGDRSDLLLLHVGSSSVAELDALSARPSTERPPIVVIGNTAHAESMRAAMRAGARDFLPEPVSEEELKASIARILSEQTVPRAAQGSQITAFVNAKGGSGATFLACNIAHMLTAVSEFSTVLLDLDFQFGALPRYLDIEPKRSLLEAIDVADDLDAKAVGAYITRHDSGLAVMSGSDAGFGMVHEDQMTDRFDAVLGLLSGSFERVVVDVPRRIESFGALVLERAHTIVLVLQQTVPSLHDATRMYEFLTRGLAVPADRVCPVVNRYHKAAAVELSDIEHAIPARQLLCVPNDFRTVSESVNIGVPIYAHAKRSPVTRALLKLEKQVGGRETAAARGFLPLLRKTG